jgi:transcription-repair coupling factor (superfamily II helicase)
MSGALLAALPALAAQNPLLGGLPEGAAPWALSVLARHGPAGALVCVAGSRDAADRLVGELRALLHDAQVPVLRLPADDARPWDGLSPHPDLPRERLAALAAWDAGRRCVIVLPARALLLLALPPERLAALTLRLRPGLAIDRDALVAELAARGYLSTQRAEEPGTMAVRGGVIDLWPTGADAPLRIETFDDELECVHRLDPKTWRGQGALASVDVLPAREAVVSPESLSRASQRTAAAVDAAGYGHLLRRKVLADLKQGLWFPAAEDYLGALHPLEPLHQRLRALPRGRAFLAEPREVMDELGAFDEDARRRWAGLSAEARPVVLPEDRHAPLEAVKAALAPLGRLGAVVVGEGDPLDFGCRDNGLLRVGKGELAPAVRILLDWLDQDWRVALTADTAARLERLMGLLTPHGLKLQRRPVGELVPGAAVAWVTPLDRGFHSADDQLAVVTADELFGARARPVHRPRTLADAALSSAALAQLKVGDFVVHIRHGVGTFVGLKRLSMPVGGAQVEQDFAELRYRGDDVMYLPVGRLHELYKHRGAGEKAPTLDKLGGQTWGARKQKVRDKVASLAAELLRLHAARAVTPGHSYPGRPPELAQFEQTFPFVETPCQERAIEEVLADLEKPEPMDRLLIGDVGFGKTEVAMRAAFQVVLGGRQVAVLCPTTVLAFQHWRTFSARFEGTGVQVGLLSSFQSSAEARDLKTQLREGRVDILIGTQALLGRGLRFQELGLVVVDEEHRFGVKQKEKLKALAASWAPVPVDYLAMSATPIPRTLHLALSGIRAVSMLTTPPEGRRPVVTRVLRWEDARIREEILHELRRGGQVFFVHNRVQTIHAVCKQLEALVPEARFAVAHGQMEPAQLEEVLMSFVRQEHHVLVCSTIIESGIDMPTVNTILINRADELGLAALYQLRGRVGRGLIRGYCTLLVPEDEAQVTPAALKRLQVLQENQELGSGMAVAQADLELRGAGDLLGESQHGQIAEVGIDVYIELLSEAVADARGELARKRLEPELEIPVRALIPDAYIDRMEDRLGAYRQLAAAQTVVDVRRVIDAWEDLYGEPPPEVLNLGWMAEARLRCRELGVERLSWLKVRLMIDLHPTTIVPPARVARLLKTQPQRFSMSDAAFRGVPDAEPGHRLICRFSPEEAEYPFRFLHWALRQLEVDPGA